MLGSAKEEAGYKPGRKRPGHPVCSASWGLSSSNCTISAVRVLRGETLRGWTELPFLHPTPLPHTCTSAAVLFKGSAPLRTQALSLLMLGFSGHPLPALHADVQSSWRLSVLSHTMPLLQLVLGSEPQLSSMQGLCPHPGLFPATLSPGSQVLFLSLFSFSACPISSS